MPHLLCLPPGMAELQRRELKYGSMSALIQGCVHPQGYSSRPQPMSLSPVLRVMEQLPHGIP